MASDGELVAELRASGWTLTDANAFAALKTKWDGILSVKLGGRFQPSTRSTAGLRHVRFRNVIMNSTGHARSALESASYAVHGEAKRLISRLIIHL